MPTPLTGADLYAAYAHQLQRATSAFAALGQSAHGNDSVVALPGTALSAFDAANAGFPGQLRNSNGLWYNRKSGFVGEVVVNAGKATLVFCSASPDDVQFWSALGAVNQTETSAASDPAALASGDAAIEDALALARAAIAQFGAASVTIAGEGRGGGLASVCAGTLGVEAYTIDTQPVGHGRTMSALLEAAANLHIATTGAATLASLATVARQFDIFAITDEPRNYDAGLDALTNVIGLANVTVANFVAAYESVLATYDANTAAHLHVIDSHPGVPVPPMPGGHDTDPARAMAGDATAGTGYLAATFDAANDNAAGGTDPVVRPVSEPRTNSAGITGSYDLASGDLGRFAHVPASAWSGNVSSFDPGDAARAATAAADYFVYLDNGPGNNVISGFTAGNVAGHDIIDFTSAVFADWAHLLAASHQAGTDTIITVDADSTITLKGVSLSALTPDDFNIV